MMKIPTRHSKIILLLAFCVPFGLVQAQQKLSDFQRGVLPSALEFLTLPEGNQAPPNPVPPKTANP